MPLQQILKFSRNIVMISIFLIIASATIPKYSRNIVSEIDIFDYCLWNKSQNFPAISWVISISQYWIPTADSFFKMFVCVFFSLKSRCWSQNFCSVSTTNWTQLNHLELKTLAHYGQKMASTWHFHGKKQFRRQNLLLRNYYILNSVEKTDYFFRWFVICVMEDKVIHWISKETHIKYF